MKVPGKINKYEIINTIKEAINEDMGSYGDITSKYLIPEASKSSAYILCKEKDGAVLSGVDIAGYIVEQIDSTIQFEKIKSDGEKLKYLDKAGKIKGNTMGLLAAERTILNFIQYMSGIATITSKFSSIASRYNVKIADTRKTKPGLRKLEKYAVTCGGGYNHRFGLYDGILIKDNHIKAAGGVKKAVNEIRKNMPHQLKIEVEVKDFNELDGAISAHADIIMLDNMTPDKIKECVNIIRKKLGSTCIIEASGNVNLANLEELCRTGVDIISVGAVTHSAPSVDFSLEFE
jgi:nicotinate-nucleotide pyrophosphorylase (carboxylating)